MTAIAYPYDPTGTFSSNYINNEVVTINTANGINAYLIIPDATPFYGDSMVVIDTTGVPLNVNSDYVLSHYWTEASTNIGKDVYGSITIKNGYLIGNYRLVYRTIGGEYVTTPLNTIQSGICGGLNQYVNVDWSTAPTTFPSIPHKHELSGIVGMTQIYQALYDIAAAVTKRPSGIMFDDVFDIAFANLKATVNPIANLMGAIGIINNNSDTAIASLLSFLQPQMSLSNISTTDKHYNIPYFGNFVFKTGRYEYEIGKEPTELFFTDPPMSGRPLFAIGNVTSSNSYDPPTQDQIFFGVPTPTKVSCTIQYHTPTVTNLAVPPVGTKPRRLITYFAIGLTA